MHRITPRENELPPVNNDCQPLLLPSASSAVELESQFMVCMHLINLAINDRLLHSQSQRATSEGDGRAFLHGALLRWATAFTRERNGTNAMTVKNAMAETL
jgi:hypothetical protein